MRCGVCRRRRYHLTASLGAPEAPGSDGGGAWLAQSVCWLASNLMKSVCNWSSVEWVFFSLRLPFDIPL